MDWIQLKTSFPYIAGYAESRIGGRSENQDSYGYADTPLGFLVTVCDGMGGGPGGKMASSIAVKEIVDSVNDANQEETIPNILIKAVRRANLAIIQRGTEQPELQGMGSTCTVLLINENVATVAHVGDSRVYQLRGTHKVFRTFDHSMVFDLVKQKVITEEQARLSAQSNVITRALGIKTDLEVEVAECPYEKGDRFMLCTDGVHGTMEEKALLKLVGEKNELQKVVTTIAMKIDSEGRNSGGGHDNLTLAIVETKCKSKQTEKMSKGIKLLITLLGIICVASIMGNISLGLRNNRNLKLEDELIRVQNVLNDTTLAEKNRCDSVYNIINNLKNKK